MSANDKQVDGKHYESAIQHWDYVAANELDYFQGQITKYVGRWKKKNGLVDLEKARHVLDKYIEIETEKERIKAKLVLEDVEKMKSRWPSGPANPSQWLDFYYSLKGVGHKVENEFQTMEKKLPNDIKSQVHKGLGMSSPFGYEVEEEIGKCEHPLAGVLQNININE